VAQYSHRASDYNLPKGKEARSAMATTIGADGLGLLKALDAPPAPPALRFLPQVRVLRAVWLQQFHAPDEHAVVRWREFGDATCHKGSGDRSLNRRAHAAPVIVEFANRV